MLDTRKGARGNSPEMVHSGVCGFAMAALAPAGVPVMRRTVTQTEPWQQSLPVSATCHFANAHVPQSVYEQLNLLYRFSVVVHKIGDMEAAAVRQRESA